MLQLNSKEGQQLNEVGSVAIPLPEDNARAMELLNVIHGCNQKAQDVLSPSDLLQVASISALNHFYLPYAYGSAHWISPIPWILGWQP